MKHIKIIVIGSVLAIALVACPIEYTRDITAGTGFLIGAVLTGWLGVRRQKGAQEEYASDVRRYTARTMMKLVRRERVYQPTYEYTVNGKTYQYLSRQPLPSKQDLGRQVVGYYDPHQPDRITENRPRKPVFSGVYFFVWTAFLLFFSIMSFTGQLSFS